MDIFTGAVLFAITDLMGQYVSNGRYDRRQGIVSVAYGIISTVLFTLLFAGMNNLPGPQNFSLTRNGILSDRSIIMTVGRLVISGLSVFVPNVSQKLFPSSAEGKDGLLNLVEGFYGGNFS